MLGYRFSPRIADLADQRFWRADLPGSPAGDYGLVNGLARNKVNLDKIRAHWPDMLRVAGSLITHRVRAYDLLRMPGRDGHPSALGQAFAEYGRIAKTLHLLALIDPVDEGYRRSVHPSSPCRNPGTGWRGRSSTANGASCASPTAKAKKTSSARSAWSSAPWCCGTPATSTPPWPVCAQPGTDC